MSATEGSMREELEKAFTATEPKAAEPVAEPAKVEESTEPAKDGATKDAPVEEKSSAEVPAEPVAAEKKADAKPEKEPEPAEKAPSRDIKPPVSWKAGAKERWKDLPADIQEEVVRRERESAVAIQQGAESRKFVEEFQRAIGPYQGIMAAEGAKDPISAVQNLMQTAAVLRMGTPIQKADLVARMIQIYGVDVQTLDSILSGQAAPEIKQQQEFDRRLAERLTPLEQKLAQYEQMLQGQTQRVQQEAATSVEDFAKTHEFVDDPEVANDMADLLEVAAKRNRSMTMEEAYERATALNPRISKILKQREAAAAASSVNVEKVKAAASSVKGSPMGGGPPSTPTDIRSQLLAAMDKLN